METKKRTLREISKNPENMTEEERKDMAELFASLKEVGKACEPYDIKTIRKNTVNTLSKRFYQEHFIMSAILESFFVKRIHLEYFRSSNKSHYFKDDKIRVSRTNRNR